jgi:hypothetical protein
MVSLVFPFNQSIVSLVSARTSANEGIQAPRARQAGHQRTAQEQDTEARGQPRWLNGV